jgi:hypothetical protein
MYSTKELKVCITYILLRVNGTYLNLSYMIITETCPLYSLLKFVDCM